MTDLLHIRVVTTPEGLGWKFVDEALNTHAIVLDRAPEESLQEAVSASVRADELLREAEAAYELVKAGPRQENAGSSSPKGKTYKQRKVQAG